MKKVLLHICCGVCAAGAVARLREEGFSVTGFYFNPNIHPQTEYEKRKKNLKIIREEFDIEVIEGEYSPRGWFNICRRFAREKEGHRRCQLCYHMRLEETCRVSEEKGYDWFTTTLTISPHKKSDPIFRQAGEIGGERFLPVDFKKKEGFKQANRFAKEHGFYRQNYCGCVYSLLKKGHKVTRSQSHT